MSRGFFFFFFFFFKEEAYLMLDQTIIRFDIPDRSRYQTANGISLVQSYRNSTDIDEVN